MGRCMRFLKDDTGAVTIDWFMITAGIVTFALLAVSIIQEPLVALITDTRDNLVTFQDTLDN